MNIKILFCLCILLFFSCLGCVCASGVGHLEDSSNISDILSVDSDMVVHQNIAVDLNVPESKGSFDNLQMEIDNASDGSVLNLNRDYYGNYGSRIWLVKDLTIDGHGHTLDCLNKKGCSAFYSDHGTIVLKNLNIINGHNDKTDKGGGIYIKGSAKFILENCNFFNNWADNSGGAIYNDNNNDLKLINCIFKNNNADDNKGGAVYSNGNIIIDNCSFDNNIAYVDGGAIFCNNNVYVMGSSFSSNSANGSKFTTYFGGAIKSFGTIIVNNSTFINNHADFGGAIYSEKNVEVDNSTFINNHANTHGGAILSKKNVKVDNCTFIGNHADKYGGAIYTNTITWINNPSYFIGNYVDSNQGGAIYTNKFETDVKHGVFINNTVKSNNNGGAIYINEENHITFSQCYFENNRCGNKGGAIYLGNAKSFSFSGLSLKYNIFVNNHAENKGEIVYNCGYYDDIKDNWYGINNPNFNNQLVEYHMFGSDEDHSDNNPVITKLYLNETDKRNTYKLTLEFLLNNSTKLNDNLFLFNAIFNADNNAKISNYQRETNKITSDITFNNGFTNINAIINNQVLKLSHNIVNMSFNVSKIFVSENATVEIIFPSDATGNVTVGNISSTIKNGVATVIIPNLTIGTNILPVIYSGDNKYNTTSTTVNITINPKPKENLTIKTNVKPITIGENATVIVTGLKKATGNVTVTVNDKIYTAPIKNGEARVNVTGLTKSVTANVNYTGDDRYNSALTNVIIIVNSGDIITDLSKGLGYDISKYLKIQQKTY